ncbi:glycoside hydrolase family 43 protein [Arthrobacter glacialis]|uniref:glycoside hydrolase family 43 protein n=1 Tax=Arthrobacter glacialis TaxID=1664 RepID=UPI001A9F186B|nr:glycoside hydrolase family 43 protein [Arthrobacter glacialis]
MSIDQSIITERMLSAAEHPVIRGFHPDPSICRVGDDYYLVNSSFEYSPGVPLWRSSDLVNWTQIGNILDRADQFSAGAAGSNGGIYAPTIRHHDGRFWMITTNVSGEPGQLLVSATNPQGPWSAAVIIPGLNGIDPDLAWGDDGTCYVTFCSNDPETSGIAQVRVDLEHGIALEAPRRLWQGTGLAYPEGPHLFRRGEWWYLLISEGGTERGHAITMARSRSPQGPFESAPNNPLFSRRSTTFPTQNTGHADFIECADGSWAMVYLGVRPRGGTPLFHVNGRETFVAKIEWDRSGWPTIVPDGFAVPAPHGFTDDFTGPGLAPRWISPGAGFSDFLSFHPEGGVALRAAAAINEAPALLSVRAQDERWRFTAVLELPTAAGLRVRMDERHWYEIRVVDGVAQVQAQIGPVHNVVVDQQQLSGSSVELMVEAADPTSNGPDDLSFSVADATGTRELGRLDGRYLSTEVAGGFTGRTIGVHALDGVARLLRVSYEPLE